MQFEPVTNKQTDCNRCSYVRFFSLDFGERDEIHTSVNVTLIREEKRANENVYIKKGVHLHW